VEDRVQVIDGHAQVIGVSATERLLFDDGDAAPR
jgi:hypothetical protein